MSTNHNDEAPPYDHAVEIARAAGFAPAAAEPGDETAELLPRVWKASELVAAQQPRWLAANRIPFAATTILVGDEGIGKSLLWVWLTSAITNGRPVPEYGIPKRAPGKVVIVVTEDDWSSAVLPRLIVAGADLDYIEVICTEQDGSGAPVFPRDVHLLEGTDASLIVVDAWLDTVPGRLNVKDPQHARQALHPWKEIATRTGAAVMLLAHTNRIASSSARDKYGATIELRKKARMTLYAQADDDGFLVVGPEKSNMTRLTAATRFSVASVNHFTPTEDSDGTIPKLTYVGEAEVTARDLVSEKHEAEHGTDHGSRDEAGEFLIAFLGDGEKPAEEVIKAAEKVGISKRTLDRAKKKVGVKSKKGDFTSSWSWVLEPKDATKIAKVARETDVSQRGNLGNLGGDLGVCRECGRELGAVDLAGICGLCELAS